MSIRDDKFHRNKKIIVYPSWIIISNLRLLHAMPQIVILSFVSVSIEEGESESEETEKIVCLKICLLFAKLNGW